MEFIDTHCHIQSAGNNGGERSTAEVWAKLSGVTSQDILSNANAANVTKVVVVGCTLSDSQLALDFANRHNSAWASIGVHPHEAEHYVNNEKEWAQFAAGATEPKVIAIGECGLDYFYNHSSKDDQIAVLHKQLQLAATHNLPLIFHVREAYDDFWPIFDQYPGLRGVLHSFTDSVANMERAVANGLYIGVNGIATFTKEPAQQAMYKAIPLKNMVLETDAPFLTPTPYRGSINEPKHVVTVASYLAQMRDIELSSIAAATTDNAMKLFGLK